MDFITHFDLGASYNSYTILFGPDELSNILCPDLFKINSNPDISGEIINCLHITLAKTLIFIHVWFIRNNNHRSLLNQRYHTYNEFFSEVLNYIIVNESNESIKNRGIIVRDCIKNYYIYMGKYHDNFLSSIYKTSELIRLIFWLFIIIKML